MRRYGKVKTHGYNIPGHQNCLICHPSEAGTKAAARKEAVKLIEEAFDEADREYETFYDTSCCSWRCCTCPDCMQDAWESYLDDYR